MTLLKASNGKWILMLDASAIGISSCLLRLYYNTVEGHREKLNSNDIEYGSAFHLFKEVISKTKNESRAIVEAQRYFKLTPMSIKPKKDWLNVEHLTRTMIRYIEVFGVEREKDNFQSLLTTENLNGISSEVPLVEGKFAIKYYVNNEFEVLLCGTIDDIGKFRNNGMYAIGDEKTTSSWDWKEYLSNYKLSGQLRFYRFCMEQLGEQYPGTIFEDITRNGNLGAFINGVFLSPTKPTEFRRSDVFQFTPGDLIEYHAVLDRTIFKILDCIRGGFKPFREGILNGSCQTKFGNCQYYNVCSMPTEQGREAMLQLHFRQETYSPLSFGGGQKEKLIHN